MSHQKEKRFNFRKSTQILFVHFLVIAVLMAYTAIAQVAETIVATSADSNPIAVLYDAHNGQTYKHLSSQSQTQQQTRVKPKIHDCFEMQTGDLKFINKTKKRIIIVLYEEEKVGFVGYDKQLTLVPNEEKTFYDLPIGMYEYEAREDAPVRVRTMREVYGKIQVAICKTVNRNIR